MGMSVRYEIYTSLRKKPVSPLRFMHHPPGQNNAYFQKFMGSPITVKLYRPYNGMKEIPAVLRGYEDGKVTAEVGKETVTFEKSQVALVRLRVEF